MDAHGASDACRSMARALSGKIAQLTDGTDSLFDRLKRICEGEEAARKVHKDHTPAGKSSSRADEDEQNLGDDHQSTTIASMIAQLDNLQVEVMEKACWV